MALISERYRSDGKPVYPLSELQKKHIEIFEEKCRSGEYKFRDRECECGCRDFDVIAEKDRYGISMDTVICRKCGLIMTNPCLDDGSNAEFYDRDYPFIYRAEEKPSEEVFNAWREDAELIVSFIQKHTGLLSGSVLEIGCADGRNVVVFKDMGYDVSGIDLSHTYVEFGKSKGLDLYCCDAATFSERGNRYDLVFLNHVLEHFTDLEKELSTIKKLMKPDGYLYIGVPGVKALAYGTYQGDFLKLLQNAHIFNFTRRSLCRVMKKYGFDCVFCNEGVYGIFQIEKSSEGMKYSNEYEEMLLFFEQLEKINGDTNLLAQYRINSIVSKYAPGEVIMYGTMIELDGFVQMISDTTPIKGFFYSDKKIPEQVAEFIKTNAKDVKCLIIVDAERNELLGDSFCRIFKNEGPEIVSAYSELF